MHSGKALIFSAPSGSGKTTIVQHLLKTRDDLKFSISATTRPPRPGEIDGKDYYFLSLGDFQNKIASNELLEWEEVYPGVFYGSLRSELDRIWNQNCHVVFDVDVVGGCNIKNVLDQRALGVFVKVKDLKTLAFRLTSRGSEDKKSIESRLGKAKHELTYESEFDVTLVNDHLEEAFKRAEELVKKFLV